MMDELTCLLGQPVDHVALFKELLKAADDEICAMRQSFNQILNAHQDNIHMLTTNMLKIAQPKWDRDELRKILLKHSKPEAADEDNILIKK